MGREEPFSDLQLYAPRGSPFYDDVVHGRVQPDLTPVTFDAQEQEHYFNQPVYAEWGIKAGNIKGKPQERIHEGVKTLVAKGAQAVILGCTELPLVFDDYLVSKWRLIDTIDVLLKSTINRCLEKTIYEV